MPLQALGMRMLRADDGLRVGQGRKGLVPLRRQEQPFQIPTEAVPPIVLAAEGIELDHHHCCARYFASRPAQAVALLCHSFPAYR